MKATFHLVRHAAHDNVGGYLAGRMPGVELGSAGLEQAERAAKRIGQERVFMIFSSPRERTRQTALAISRACNVAVETTNELDEVDFGRWSGHDFASLDGDMEWRRWNAARSLGQTP